MGLAGAAFLLQGKLGLDLADEGFLWMGVVRTAHGGVPLRDFYSYDPGRYLWGAAWAPALGEGILALRLSTAVFAAGGLFCGLLAARRVTVRWLTLALVGLVLLLWMFPRHKLFEPSVAMAAVYVAVRVLENPSRRNCFLAGVTVGLATLLGKNHGLYCGLAFLALLLLLHWRWGRGAPSGAGEDRTRFGERLGSLGAGFAAGAIPLLSMMAFVPGFARAYLDSILFFVHEGRTNSPLPVPWPWRVGFADAGLAAGLEGMALGLAFLLLPLFYALVAVLAWKTNAADLPRRKVLLAGLLVGGFYMHHAFSRADAPHLAQSIHPALLGLLALPAALGAQGRRSRRLPPPSSLAAAALAAGLTLFAAVPQSPLAQEVAAARRGRPYVAAVVAGDRLRLPAPLAASLAAAAAAVDERVSRAEPLLVFPNAPGLYPVLRREPPVWDTFITWPAAPGSDERMVSEIEGKGVRWALGSGTDADPGFMTSLSGSHPLLAAYLGTRFARVAEPRLPAHLLLLRQVTASELGAHSSPRRPPD
jgi:hypothetical protein